MPFSDAYLSIPIEEVDRLWARAEKEKAPGHHRAVDRSLIGIRQPFFRDRIGGLFNLLMRVMTVCPFATHSTTSNCLNHKPRALFYRQRLDVFGFDVEVLYIARRLGLKCIEVPVRWNDVAGTKVSLWRGISAFLDPLRVRWNSFTCKYQ